MVGIKVLKAGLPKFMKLCSVNTIVMEEAVNKCPGD
jgi:hypothetical protein